jgi:Flp pilus assembly protein CpaB
MQRKAVQQAEESAPELAEEDAEAALSTGYVDAIAAGDPVRGPARLKCAYCDFENEIELLDRRRLPKCNNTKVTAHVLVPWYGFEGTVLRKGPADLHPEDGAEPWAKAFLEVAVPVRTLATNELIVDTDLTTKALDISTLPAGTVASKDGLVGKVTLKSLLAELPVVEPAVAPAAAQLPADHVEVGIAATPPLTFGDSLKPGDRLRVLVTPARRVQGTRAARTFEVTLLRLIATTTTTPGVLFVALEKVRQEEFAEATAGGSIVATRTY